MLEIYVMIVETAATRVNVSLFELILFAVNIFCIVCRDNQVESIFLFLI